MITRLTWKQLKDMCEEHRVPDNAIICCQSDEEGNRTMVCDTIYIDKVGHISKFQYDGKDFEMTGGEDIEGIDMEQDKGKIVITIHPLY